MTAPGNVFQSGPNVVRGSQNDASRDFASGLSRQAQGANSRTNDLFDLFSTALRDPTGQAGGFLSFFQDALQSSLEPQFEAFDRRDAAAQGNVASRFGGNASSEETRVRGLGAEAFQRNISRQASQLGPQALSASFQNTGLLGNAFGQAAGIESQLLQQILQALGLTKPDDGGGFNVGQALGTVGGGIIGAIAGGPPGATAGAGVGGSAFA